MYIINNNFIHMKKQAGNKPTDDLVRSVRSPAVFFQLSKYLVLDFKEILFIQKLH